MDEEDSAGSHEETVKLKEYKSVEEAIQEGINKASDTSKFRYS